MRVLVPRRRWPGRPARKSSKHGNEASWTRLFLIELPISHARSRAGWQCSRLAAGVAHPPIHIVAPLGSAVSRDGTLVAGVVEAVYGTIRNEADADQPTRG